MPLVSQQRFVPISSLGRRRKRTHLDMDYQEGNTIPFASLRYWHIPCYAAHNCAGINSGSQSASTERRVQAASVAGGQGLTFTGNASAFSASFVLASVLSASGAIAACAAGRRCKRGSDARSIFVASMIAADYLSCSFSGAVHAAHLSFGSVSGGLCSSWVFLQLAGVSVRSWLTPVTVLIFHLHHGCIPIKRYVQKAKERLAEHFYLAKGTLHRWHWLG